MNCIIIDDEPLAREGMRLLVGNRPDLNLTGSFNGVKKALEFLEHNSVDLIFLDIEMPGTNGIQFASTISAKTLIVFTTAYEQYALQSYEVDAVDYLLKPILEERFDKAVNKAAVYLQLMNDVTAQTEIEIIETDYILIKADRRFHKIAYNEIKHIEGLKDYVVIYINDTKIITAMNLKTICAKLPASIFIRVSKSYVVNKDHIKSFDTHEIFLQKTAIPLGEVYRKAFLELYLGKDASDKL